MNQQPEIISDDEMQHLKKLARLEMNEAETSSAKKELNKILGFFKELQKIDTTGLPEMVRPVALVNVMREDVAEEGMSQKEALAVAVESENGFFKVPRIIE